MREHSILRLASDIRDAEVWDEAAIRARSERLGHVCLDTWIGPIDATPGEEAAPEATAAPTAGPDGDDLAEVLAMADSAQVGRELRSAIARCLSFGMHVRAFPFSVMFSPRADHRVMIFTVWPQPDAPGTFIMSRSPKALADYWPGISPDQALAALGSEGRSEIAASDLPRVVEGLARLVEPGLAVSANA